MSPEPAPARRLHVATRKGLFILERDGAGSWEIVADAFVGDPVTMVLADGRPGGALYAALNLGHFGAKLHRSRDGGGSWEECAVPVYPEKPEQTEGGGEGGEEDPHPWSLKQIWALETGGPDEPGTLWAGTIPGGLFRSDDGSDSWRLIESLWRRPERRQWFGGGYDTPGIHSILVDPRDARTVLVGVSCGGAWTTTDGGESWEVTSHGMIAEYMPPERRDDPVIQDPHRIVRCAGTPDHLWTAHHNGVFRSTNGGRRWEEVTAIAPSKFGFATAVHPRDPATAWFVPAVKDECRVPVDARVVVARTRDGGESFEVLTRGLPQKHAYDLVYRHALDIDGTGSTLAIGSTTGSVWTTDDGGDTWDLVNAHLPPVYAVRFE